jgi:hypothetical protein
MPIETFAQPVTERGWSAVPAGAPEWALKMITEYRSAVQRGEHRAIVITPKAGDFAPMVRAVHGDHPVERRSVTKFVGKKKKKWTGPSADDLRGAAEFKAREEAWDIKKQQEFLNIILS